MPSIPAGAGFVNGSLPLVGAFPDTFNTDDLDLDTQVDLAWAALARVYPAIRYIRQGHDLFRVGRHSPNLVTLTVVTDRQLRRVLARAARWTRTDPESGQICSIPVPLAVVHGMRLSPTPLVKPIGCVRALPRALPWRGAEWFVANLRAREIVVSPRGNGLRVDDPLCQVTDSDRERLRAFRSEIVGFLMAEALPLLCGAVGVERVA